MNNVQGFYTALGRGRKVEVQSYRTNEWHQVCIGDDGTLYLGGTQAHASECTLETTSIDDWRVAPEPADGPLQHAFLWFDIETTGLIHGVGGLNEGGALLEWALVLAADDRTGDMSPVRQFQAVIGHDVSKLQMDPFVRNMHTNSGLLAEVAASKTTLQESDDFLADLCMNELGAKPRSLTLAGNSIGQLDFPWVQVHLPKFASYLHHRVLDVSTLQRAHEEWLGAEPIRAPAHRALDDVKASLAACKAWRDQAGL